MKIAILFAVAAVTLSSIPSVNHRAAAAAAQVNESADTQAQVSGKQNQLTGTAQGSATANGPANKGASVNSSDAAAFEMRPVKAELMGKLDSKSAKVGERVVAKTEEEVRTANGTVIPKGTYLVGHVTEVQSHGSGHPNSSLGIEFDRAELKGGQTIAIRSVIDSVAPPADLMAMNSMQAQESMESPMAPMGDGRPTGGLVNGGSIGAGRAGGGLVGGTAGGATSAVGNAAPGLGTTAGGALNTTGNLAGNAAAGVGNGVRGSTEAAESRGAYVSAIPGVMLAGDASGSASGLFSASKRNIHLDSGTQMMLGVGRANRP